MTILGEHTVHELNDLVNALSYEVTQTQKAIIACTAWAQRDPSAFADWNTKLVQAMAPWSDALHIAMVRIGETPQALWDAVPAEAHYQGCLTAYHPFDDLIRTFMQQSQCPISFDQMPQPTAADFDLDAYKSADKATKWIETQGSAAAGKAKSYAPVVVLGLGVVAAFAIAAHKIATRALV
ncbi:MAG: hypothetical protein ABSE49_25690 [Polyangiaceae bacterium]|jgi:hypothetical protein